jgi:hypothetical protein
MCLQYFGDPTSESEDLLSLHLEKLFAVDLLACSVDDVLNLITPVRFLISSFLYMDM